MKSHKQINCFLQNFIPQSMRIITKNSITSILCVTSCWFWNLPSRASAYCYMDDAEVELVILEDCSYLDTGYTIQLEANAKAYPKLIDTLPVKSLEVALALVGSKPTPDRSWSVCLKDFLAKTPNLKYKSSDLHTRTETLFAELPKQVTGTSLADDFASAISYAVMSGRYFSSRPDTLKILMVRVLNPPVVNKTGDLDMSIFKEKIPHCVSENPYTEPALYPSDTNMRQLFDNYDVVPLFFAATKDTYMPILPKWGVSTNALFEIGTWDKSVQKHYDIYFDAVARAICDKLSHVVHHYTKRPVPTSTPKPKPPTSPTKLSTHPPTQKTNDSGAKKGGSVSNAASGVIGAACVGLVALTGGLTYWGVQKWRERRQIKAIESVHTGEIEL